ncbi:hypothetical protein BCT27_02905 [Enterovibrio norvegicus]|nr:hypothetical protein BCT27_02905 [Enterovibrio norvegicus]
MKVSLLNKLLLGVEGLIVGFLLLLSLVLLVDDRPLFFIMLLLSILSMVSLIYLLTKTILGSVESVRKRFVYLSHVGLLVTAFGFFILLINGNEFKNHSPNAPFSIFAFGAIALIPYCHVMVINRFFKHHV